MRSPHCTPTPVGSSTHSASPPSTRRLAQVLKFTQTSPRTGITRYLATPVHSDKLVYGVVPAKKVYTLTWPS